MAGSSNQYSYQFGGTQIVIGASLAVQVNPPPKCNGWVVGYLSGGTLALVGAATLAPGYILGTTDQIACEGPATFFLGAASGTTAVARVIFKYASGFSQFP